MKLLVAHGVVTLAAGIVLVAAPDLIPATVGVTVDSDAYLVCYLLGAAEFAMAMLSFGAARLRDPAALRLVSVVFVALHLSTAAVEGYAFAQGVGVGIWGNVAVRIAVAALFWFYGVRRTAARVAAP